MATRMPKVTSVLLADGLWHAVVGKSFTIDTRQDLSFTTFRFTELVSGVSVVTYGLWQNIKAYRE